MKANRELCDDRSNPFPHGGDAIEADVVTIRSRLDYPGRGGTAAYIAALEALDRLAIAAHRPPVPESSGG